MFICSVWSNRLHWTCGYWPFNDGFGFTSTDMAVAMLLVIPLLQYSCAQTFETQLPMHCGHACFVGMLGRWYLYGTWLVKLAILVAGLFPTVKIYEDCGSSIDPLGMSISIMMHNPLPCLMVNLSAYCAHTIAMRVCEENWKILSYGTYVIVLNAVLALNQVYALRVVLEVLPL